MREKKHIKHIRAGNLVRVITNDWIGFDHSVIITSRYGERLTGEEVRLVKGDIGLVLETGISSISGRGTCVILFGERKLNGVGDFWHDFERVKRDGEA